VNSRVQELGFSQVKGSDVSRGSPQRKFDAAARAEARRLVKATPRVVAPDPTTWGIGPRLWHHRCVNGAIVFLSLAQASCDRCGLLQETVRTHLAAVQEAEA